MWQGFPRGWLGLFALIASLASGCMDESNGSLENESGALEATVTLTASAASEIRTRAGFYYRMWEQPMVTRLQDLPTSGDVASENRPYSGYWYPERLGGTNVGNPSPLKKYDDAFHEGQPLSMDWEVTHHTRSANDQHADWAGHCNGFAAAAARHREPRDPVTLNGVTFTPADIKALLAEVHMSVKSVFLAGRRCRATSFNSNPGARPDPTVMDACEDANPASFHLAIANWIGRQGQTLIFDSAAGYQVWNFPLYRFSSQVEANVSQTRALELIGVSSQNYIFNPDAVAFAHVRTTVTYANTFQNRASETQGSYPRHSANSRTYTYILELDAQGDIIGGEWTGRSQQDHPDFVWVALEPVRPTGDPQFGNPFVDHEQVIRLWALSVGEDPDNPPLSIMEPDWQSNWGRFANFSVTLDGNDFGAVFLGKDAVLAVERSEDLHGDITLDLGLNDRIITSLSGSGDDDMSFNLKPGPGLNRLAFIWRRDGREVDRAFLRFHAVP